MQNLYDFKFWVGVCEDIDDPLKAGRIRIRMFGYHTVDKDVLPTSDLPWTLPMLPITSASISGKGSTPVGVVTGSWCVGFWIDPDQQISIVFGTVSGITPAISNIKTDTIFKQVPEREIVANKDDGTLKDSSGTPVLDGSGNPIAVAKPEQSGWTLGQTSEKEETGGRGAGTINDYNGAASGDYGGASYGQYQFASYLPAVMPNGKSRKNANRSPLKIYLSVSKYGSKFEGLEPATSAFDSMWTSLASDSNFKTDQHDYIKSNYYDVMLSDLRRNGLDLTKFGIAVQDLVWSTAVQYGAHAVSVFITPLSDKSQLTDAEIVTLVQDYKYKTVDKYFKSSPNLWDGIKARCLREKTALLALIK